jgi:hypothetical protein
MAERDPNLEVANASGFPLQIAIENLVKTNKSQHGWRVAYAEHSWANRHDGKSGFIDLVLKNEYATLVLECKRVRDTAWVFLPSDGNDRNRSHCKAWVNRYVDGRMKRYGWYDLTVSPATPEALFCAVRGQSNQPMLERIGAELVSATEALAAEERDFRSNHEHVMLYFNVIVTTAEIKVCRFSPDSISIGEGVLQSADIATAPFVRFRKQLAARGEILSPDDYSSGQNPAEKKEQTVFVVNSNHFLDFLTQFHVGDSSFRSCM